MKRAKQLQPLSREHHLGLHLSRHAKSCPDDPADIIKHWSALTRYIHNDMKQHFSIEDNLLTNALKSFKDQKSEVADVIEILESQHRKLAELSRLPIGQMTPSIDHLHKLADALYSHIRFEERRLFPIAEQYLSEATLDSIYNASANNVKKTNARR